MVQQQYQNQNTRQQQQRQPQPIKVAIETEEPEKIDNSWSILATTVVTQGNRTLDGREMQFFINGIPYDQPIQTDDNGRAQIDITGISATLKKFSVGAQIVGQSFMARKIIQLPEVKPVTKTPAELTVDPRRIGNKLNFFILVTDEEKRGVPNARLTIIDGHKVKPDFCDKYGEKLFSVSLRPEEEKEIGIYVAGFGDKGFCRTFKGRSAS